MEADDEKALVAAIRAGIEEARAGLKKAADGLDEAQGAVDASEKQNKTMEEKLRGSISENEGPTDSAAEVNWEALDPEKAHAELVPDLLPSEWPEWLDGQNITDDLDPRDHNDEG